MGLSPNLSKNKRFIPSVYMKIKLFRTLSPGTKFQPLDVFAIVETALFLLHPQNQNHPDI